MSGCPTVIRCSTASQLAIADLARYPLPSPVFPASPGSSKMDKAFGRHGSQSPHRADPATDSDIIISTMCASAWGGVIATSAFDEADRESLVCLSIDHLIASGTAQRVCLRGHAHLRDYACDFIPPLCSPCGRGRCSWRCWNQSLPTSAATLPPGCSAGSVPWRDAGGIEREA